MAIQGIGQAGLPGVSGAASPHKASFAKSLKPQPPVKAEAAAIPAKPLNPQRAMPGPQQARAAQATPPQAKVEPTKLLDQVSAAQKRMDAVLELAQSGKSFTPAELLSLQTQMYRASQELDLAGKVVEKATGGVKQILQTQV